MSLAAEVWLHVAAVPEGAETSLFEVLCNWGFRPQCWSPTSAVDGLRGNFALHPPYSDADMHVLGNELSALGTSFAIQRLPGDGTVGWRMVSMPGVGVASGSADEFGRFVVDSDEIREAIADAATALDANWLQRRLRELAGLDVTEAFDALWETVEL